MYLLLIKMWKQTSRRLQLEFMKKRKFISNRHAATNAQQLPKTSDVIVIGGGVVGTSTSYHLAKRGLKVTLLERHK